MVSKEKSPEGRYALNAGRFYYDTQIKQVIYQIRFPKPETVVSQDTLLYYFRKGKIVSRVPSFAIPEMSIFNLTLMGKMKDFGLKNSQYTIEKVERDGGKVYVTWKPVAALSTFGKIKLAQQNNRLEGIIFFDKKGNQVAKQLFRNYQTVGGIDFPGEVVMTSTRNGRPYIMVTTYKNIVINDFKDTQSYRVTVPKS